MTTASLRLLRRLFLPLAAVLVVALILDHYFPARGFFINIAAAPVGILLTVLFVDQVVREGNEAPWQGSDIRIRDRVRGFATGAASGLREILGVRLTVDQAFPPGVTRLDQIQLAAVRHAEATLSPNLDARLDALEAETWHAVHGHLQRVRDDSDRILLLFGRRLTPPQFESLVAIGDQARRAMSTYAVRPHIYRPESQLAGEDGEWLAARRVWIASAAKEIRSFLTTCGELTETTVECPPERQDATP